MNQKSVAILMVLALIGVGMAFAFVGLMESRTPPSEDVWMYPKPVKEESKLMPMLTEEQREKAIEIGRQNETVKQYLKQGYEIHSGSIAAFGTISRNETEMESVYVTFRRDKDWVFADVDLNEEKVTGILKSYGEIAGLEMREGGMIKAVNETGIRIGIGGEGKLIRAPEVRELTEEEREKARKIALSDLVVQNIIKGKSYEMKIKSMGMVIINEAGEVETKFNGASVALGLEDGTIYFVHVDLERGEVIRIGPPLLSSPMPPINK
nr:conserved hypothetical secreted protein [uncultured archaeon]